MHMQPPNLAVQGSMAGLGWAGRVAKVKGGQVSGWARVMQAQGCRLQERGWPQMVMVMGHLESSGQGCRGEALREPPVLGMGCMGPGCRLVE